MKVATQHHIEALKHLSRRTFGGLRIKGGTLPRLGGFSMTQINIDAASLVRLAHEMQSEVRAQAVLTGLSVPDNSLHLRLVVAGDGGLSDDDLSAKRLWLLAAWKLNGSEYKVEIPLSTRSKASQRYEIASSSEMGRLSHALKTKIVEAIVGDLEEVLQAAIANMEKLEVAE